MIVQLTARSTVLASAEVPGRLAIVPDGLRVRQMDGHITILDVPSHDGQGALDVLVGSVALVYWGATTGLPKVTFLSVPPPPPFGEVDVDAMWVDLVTSPLPLTGSIQSQGRAEGRATAAASGFDPEAVPSALSALSTLARRWPSREASELIWRPPDVRGGREDAQATDRLGGRRGGRRRRPGIRALPDLTARRRGTDLPWGSRRLAAACLALDAALRARSAGIPEDNGVGGSIPRIVARRSLATATGVDTSFSSWPEIARGSFRKVTRALIALEASGEGGVRVPLSELWRLYEHWVAVQAFKVLRAHYGEPAQMNTPWWTCQWTVGGTRVLLHSQATIGPEADQRITGHPDGLLSITSDLRPDAIIGLSKDGAGQAIICLDAKQRTSLTSMLAADVAAAASKYLWGLRGATERDTSIVAQTFIVSSAPVPTMFDDELARITATYLTPTNGFELFASRLTTAVDAAVGAL